ncbi:Holliday junction branch migration protein RuvA [Ruania halotolerans]|uniref:Holliday junction branch migration protein RuvA n=1 Tax=Ruania halotolerans TaxID=2897773 RepID=UPI001E2F99AC|nr:Holliday junction branch migration protein RuvA [Ruania halotolerans]UFU04766.1 Holliday junction branch migration protein RuvA [Ruania halotolerans]
MIASVSGRVAHIGLDACVLETGGLGYRVHATPGTLARLRSGAEATLATTLVVREDSMTLFGFVDSEERDVFEMVQTVSGVGPRLALAMLAVHNPEDLRRAVATEDTKALTLVPGIGQKGARRIILELGDRLGPATEGAPPTPATASAASTRADVVAALTGLGWAVKQAESAVDAVLTNSSQDEADTGAVLRAALLHLGGGRG